LDCPCDRIETTEDDDATSITEPVQDDRNIDMDSAPGFIVASQVKVVDSQRTNKAVSTFFGVQSTILIYGMRLSVLEKEKGGARCTG
jgi:hypothetical protein